MTARCGSLLLAVVVLAGTAFPSFAVGTDAARDLLTAVARNTRHIRTLSADFRQEKTLSFLESPLVSEGHLCLVRTQSAEEPQVLWEYVTPVASGFLYENGRGYLWMKERAAKRPVSGQEGVILKAMTSHILAWIDVEPERLARLYTMERPDARVPMLRLTPRQKGAFFTTLEVAFAPDLRTVRSLTFVEQGGDTTRLIFASVGLDAPLPAYCRP